MYYILVIKTIRSDVCDALMRQRVTNNFLDKHVKNMTNAYYTMPTAVSIGSSGRVVNDLRVGVDGFYRQVAKNVAPLLNTLYTV